MRPLVTLIGNVGRDPEQRFTPSGKPFTEFSVAANVGRYNKETGEWSDDVNWYRVTVWGEKGDKLIDRIHKGSKVLVHGTLEARPYQTADGQDRTSLDVNASDVETTERQGGGGFVYDEHGRPIAGSSAPRPQPQPQAPGGFVAPAGGFSAPPKAPFDDLDDLPF